MGEYSVIDPEAGEMHFFTLDAGRFVPLRPVGDDLKSRIVPGFNLKLERVKALF